MNFDLNLLKDINDQISGAKTKESYIIRHFPIFYEYCQKLNLKYKFDNFSQLLYHIFNKITEIPTCKYCNSKVKYINLFHGYQTYCNYKCTGKGNMTNEDVVNKIKNTNIKNGGAENPFCKNHKSYQKKTNTVKIKYDVDNVFQSEEIKTKSKQTKFELYGNENYNNSDKAKETNKNKSEEEKILKVLKSKKTKLERYDDENYVNSELGYKTKREKYGKDLNIIYDKTKETWSNKTEEEKTIIFNKGKQTRLTIKSYKNTKLKYQGLNEYKFLELCESLNILDKITHGPSIRYLYENTNHVYFSDFYYKDINLVIEIKSWYTYNNKLNISLSKQEATIKEGYNYIFIIDNDFTEFIKLISNKYNYE